MLNPCCLHRLNRICNHHSQQRYIGIIDQSYANGPTIPQNRYNLEPNARERLGQSFYYDAQERLGQSFYYGEKGPATTMGTPARPSTSSL